MIGRDHEALPESWEGFGGVGRPYRKVKAIPDVQGGCTGWPDRVGRPSWRAGRGHKPILKG